MCASYGLKTSQVPGPLLATFATGLGLPMIRYLAEKRNVDLSIGFGSSDRTVLLTSAGKGNLSVVRYVLANVPKGHVDHKTGSGSGLGLSALQQAAHCGHPEVIKLLLEHGADIHIRRSNGRTPLHEACLNGELEAAQALIDGGADVHSVDDAGATPYDLAVASRYSSERIAQLKHLLQLKMEVSV